MQASKDLKGNELCSYHRKRELLQRNVHQKVKTNAESTTSIKRAPAERPATVSDPVKQFFKFSGAEDIQVLRFFDPRATDVLNNGRIQLRIPATLRLSRCPLAAAPSIASTVLDDCGAVCSLEAQHSRATTLRSALQT